MGCIKYLSSYLAPYSTSSSQIINLNKTLAEYGITVSSNIIINFSSGFVIYSAFGFPSVTLTGLTS